MSDATPFTDTQLEAERRIVVDARERHERGEPMDDLLWGRMLGLEKYIATIDALRAERQDALLSADGHKADADRLVKQVEEMERVLDRAAQAGRVPTKRLTEIIAGLDVHHLNAPERKELEDAILERDWLIDQLDLANEHVQDAERRVAVFTAETKELRECLALAVGALGPDSPLKLKPHAFERFAAILGWEVPSGE